MKKNPLEGVEVLGRDERLAQVEELLKGAIDCWVVEKNNVAISKVFNALELVRKEIK